MTKHYSYEDWCRYVKNEEGSNREDMETHLYTCDQCLEIYLQVLADEESKLPTINNDIQFTDLVMVEIANLKKETIPLKKNHSFYQSSVFHYLLAAAMTLILMGSGVFQTITKYTDAVQSPQVIGQTTSFTETFINKTFTWMDSININNKEDRK